MRTDMFADREDGARRLAKRLAGYQDARDAVVVAIPRGGVVTGAALARALRLPLEVILTKKLGHPRQPEYAIGVVNLAHETINEEVVARDGISREYLRAETARIRKLLQERSRAYHAGRPPVSLAGKTVIVVDDGAATGHTILAAVRLARAEGAAKVVAAVPVAPPDTLARLRAAADEAVCVLVPDSFFAIGEFYQDFSQVEDEEAMRLLREAAPGAAA